MWDMKPLESSHQGFYQLRKIECGDYILLDVEEPERLQVSLIAVMILSMLNNLTQRAASLLPGYIQLFCDIAVAVEMQHDLELKD